MESTQPESAGPRGGRLGWVWSFLPINVGVAGFNTLVPLYILALGGDVVQVSLFTTLYNAVLIPASIFWGRATDRLKRRRIFFVIASAGTTAVFAAMFLLPNLGDLAALYAALGLVVTANAVAANLLVMETSRKNDWISSYSTLYLMVNLGSIVGVSVGILWTSALPLGAFLVFCAAATCASVVLSYRLVSEPGRTPEAGRPPPVARSLPSRLRHGAALLARRIAASERTAVDAIRAVRAARAGAMTGSVLLFFSAFLFTTGSAFFNTPFVPFLVRSGLVDDQVFAVSLINTVAATLVYRWMGGFAKWFGGEKVGLYVIVARTVLCLVLAAAAALLVSGSAMFLLAMAFYALMGLTYAVWNSSTSVALLASLGRARQGSLIGLYAALGALGTVAGSLFTGYVAYYLGYQTTFVVAAAVMLLSAYVLKAALRSLGRTEVGPDHEPASR
ncbi:MAG: MFS transporter [Nitrososphaerales archaeon]|jgi:MFS family permease